jgi:signal peptidase II
MWPLFAALSVGAAVGIFVWLFAAGAARDWLLTVALALVTAGIFGNLYDRLGLPGLVWNNGQPVHAVRDFILMMIGPWHWPTYNLADSSLVCGAALLVCHALFAKAEGAARKAEEEQTEGGTP